MSTKRVGKKAVVLIKQPETAAIVKSALESSGFEVSAAKSAEEARKMAADSDADLVLVDEGGDEACEKARKVTTVLEEFFRVNLDLLCIADTSGRFLQLNPEWEKILGFSIPELLETNFLELVHPEDKGRTLEAIDTLKEQREVTGFTNRYRTKGGDYRWIEWRSYPSGDVIYAAARDITDRIRMEQELRDREEKYRLIVDNISDLLVKVDAEGRFLYVSPSYCATFGKSEAELLGRTFLPLVHEEDRASTVEAMKALNVPPHRAYMEQRAMTVQGWKWLAWSDTAMLDKEGRVKEIIGVGRDITERKKIEEELEAAVAEKQALLKELQHRVKNTLSMIASLASLEEMRMEEAPIKEIIAGFKGRISSLALLYDMLYRTGDTKEVELGAYFEGIANSVRDSLLNRKGRIVLLTDCDSVTMGVKNATQLGLIVNEVLTNALKYAFPGDRKGRVSLTLRSTEDLIVITIEDDGIGFPAGFDPDQSSGMGFQLLRMFAEQMGGTSEIGNGAEGTRIVLNLPRPR